MPDAAPSPSPNWRTPPPSEYDLQDSRQWWQQQPCRLNSEGRRNGCLKNLNSDGLLYTAQCSWHLPRITVWPFVGKYYRLSLPREVQKQSVHTTASIRTDNQSRDDEYRGVLLGKDLRFEVVVRRKRDGRMKRSRNRQYDRVNRLGPAPLRCGNALHRQIDLLLEVKTRTEFKAR